jgi:hypothetical protein
MFDLQHERFPAPRKPLPKHVLPQKVPRKNNGVVTYESFSEYLRVQFLNSRNLFQHYQSYRNSQKDKPKTINEEMHGKAGTPATQETFDEFPEQKVNDFQRNFCMFATNLSCF